MNDLEDLKDAMHSTPDFEPRPLDLDAVLAQGGRLRRRRRFAVGATAGVAVLALLVGGAQVARLGGDEGAPGSVPAAGSPGRVAVSPAGDVLGDVIETGLRTSAGEQVLWVKPLEEDALPGVTFGLVLGRRTAQGGLVSDILINETEGSDRAPGFHSPEGPMEVNGVPTPAFGYYAGPGVAKITVTTKGRQVQARTAVWSEDPSIVVFWFDPAEIKPGAALTKLSAFDKDGGLLTGSGASFGVG
ncbi:hypothetical protein COUCH_11935 [Couchioplanes caeruleus]|uniref:hypothetical protein n=1 Tax=Couchioplanes caeruleus TaxID=56438 RepID=UPI0020BE958D|nr:hypothetical protein [Couchioplanes caeruleus]UQU66932.1 hypothetical protein COUCH_11935 [Couchioplanes caeruleus]